jgi:hypothetical protein
VLRPRILLDLDDAVRGCTARFDENCGPLFRYSHPEGTVAIDAFVPRLPTGTSGLRALVTYQSVGSTSVSGERDLACGPTSCAPLTLTALSAGVYDVSLTIYDDHPLVAFDDGTTYGQSVVATIPFGQVTVPESRAIRSMSGIALDGLEARSANRTALSFAVRHRPTGTGADGWFAVSVRGATRLTMWSMGIDRLGAVGQSSQATGRGVLIDGTKVRWQLTVVDGARPGRTEDRYRVRIWRTDRRGNVRIIYDTQLGAPDDAAPSSTPDLGDFRITPG